MYSMWSLELWRTQSETRCYEAFGEVRKITLGRTSKGEAMNEENRVDYKDDNGECGMGIGRMSRRRLKLIKIQNKKQRQQAVIWDGGKWGR